MLRFSPTNPFDCILFYKKLYCLELKSTQSTMTFYKSEFMRDGTKASFNVKKNQIEGLLQASQYDGIVAGIVINFRNTNHTYFIEIKDFVRMIDSIAKKSFNEKDIIQYDGYLIEQTLKKVNYTYNVEKFLQEL